MFRGRGICCFAVMDGHGGAFVAAYLRDHLMDHLLQVPRPWSSEGLQAAVVALDRDVRAKLAAMAPHDCIGSTVAFLLMEDTNAMPPDGVPVWMVHAGDTRILVIDGDRQIQYESKDHRVGREDEKTRIVEAGGHISSDGYVDAGCCLKGLLRLNVTRSLGDPRFKKDTFRDENHQKVIALPDVQRVVVYPGWKIFLMCDGFFESSCGSTDTWMQRLQSWVAEDANLTCRTVCGNLVGTALKTGSKDNLSVLLLSFSRIASSVRTRNVVEKPLKTRGKKRRSETELLGSIPKPVPPVRTRRLLVLK